MDYQLPAISPPYVIIGSDYSAQEPRITAFLSQDKNLIKAFQEGRDVYATIASVAFKVPYENCLEFHPETHEYQPDGKARRGEAKTILLGVTYGRSIQTIAEQLYSSRDDMTDEQKLAGAQEVFDAVMNSFPGIRNVMIESQKMAAELGYVTTILGRRRHIPDMQLPRFEFKPMVGYVNPDVDPLDPSTFSNKSEIPERIVKQLTAEFKNFKYYGQIVKRTKQLAEEKIKVINNSQKITEATRECLNCVDAETEILTTKGWKHYDEISKGDSILSYSLDKQQVTLDVINDVFLYPGQDTEVVEFNSPTFSAVSTLGHRWVVGDANQRNRFKTTENIYKNKWPDYPILRVSDNEFEENTQFSDSLLKLIGYVLTDGHYVDKPYRFELFQTDRKPKNKDVYASMISVCDKLGLSITDHCTDYGYHTIYIKKCATTDAIIQMFPNRTLTPEFILSLSQCQAQIVMWAMLEGDGTGYFNPDQSIEFVCNSIERRDMFQMLAFVAGYATNSHTTTPDQANAWTNGRMYDSISNSSPVECKHEYYEVTVLKIQRAHIYPHHKSKKTIDFVWCVNTNNSTWIARRQGKVYITGNSRVQGSAADQTKLALLLISRDEEWKKLGARVICPVHDEILAEVPIQNAERAGELLSELMCKAAEFLPFPSKCDVEQSFRWYGLEAPCKYTQPSTIDNLSALSEDEIKWVQYCLFEHEYTLPVYKDEQGNKPKGDAAKGINGVHSPELESAIREYCKRYGIRANQFIDHIAMNTFKGRLPDPSELSYV